MIKEPLKPLNISEIDKENCYFNPGCPIYFHNDSEPERILAILRKRFGPVKMHNECCRSEPHLLGGATIINNCAGCDRRFRNDYEGVKTISLWEILDSIELLPLPQYHGLNVSVHDSCSYRRRPEVHDAVRSLLKKMNIEIIESEFSRENSQCCGDNFYGLVPNEKVIEMQKRRAAQFPCDKVVCTCIGCVKSLATGGKKPLYLVDLVLGEVTDPRFTDLDQYHDLLDEYISWRSNAELDISAKPREELD